MKLSINKLNDINDDILLQKPVSRNDTNPVNGNFKSLKTPQLLKQGGPIGGEYNTPKLPNCVTPTPIQNTKFQRVAPRHQSP